MRLGSGIMVWSTFRVVVHPNWYNVTAPPADGPSVNGPGASKVSPSLEAKQVMLGLMYKSQATSRLGFQIWLTTELDGLVTNIHYCIPMRKSMQILILPSVIALAELREGLNTMLFFFIGTLMGFYISTKFLNTMYM